MLTFVLWVMQSKSLGEEDDASYKASFFLMIVAMLHYMLATSRAPPLRGGGFSFSPSCVGRPPLLRSGGQ
ncbi:hypothetical protein PR003_g35099 [Phytophthora rubi]|uniref:Uncharacterized protein n=2 Tax=Phytophthora rubi TaxID=129364 RepID=A0A6A3G1Z9_9STRA|nr:hypothetical protein PR002_g33176 [Phytophthora rubi]KAE9258707.1 hypothetical protein PR003_g35099 [Phytophthora rubi]